MNYGYLVRKPGSGSLLDPLGPWPVYVVASLGILLAVWALMTWPWVRSGDARGAGAEIRFPRLRTQTASSHTGRGV